MSAHFYRARWRWKKDSHASRMGSKGVNVVFWHAKKRRSVFVDSPSHIRESSGLNRKSMQVGNICKKERLSIERICWMPNMPSAFRLYNTGDEWVKCAWLTSVFSSTVHFTHGKKAVKRAKDERNCIIIAFIQHFFSAYFSTLHTLRAFITLRKVAEHDENLHDSCSTRMQRRWWKKRENLIFSSSLQKRERPLRDLMNE